MRFIGRKIAAIAIAVTFTAIGLPELARSEAGTVETRSTSLRTQFHAESKGLSGRYGYILMDAKTGKILDQRNADQSFIPASLSKIPTTLVALHALGKNHRFEFRYNRHRGRLAVSSKTIEAGS